MDVITRKLRPKRGADVAGRKLSSTLTSNDSIPSSSETDGPFGPKHSKSDLMDMLPNKLLEERVLIEWCEYLTENLPADDVAPMMASQNLLTPREHDEYKAMKRSGKSIICLSEYLLDCLRKRQAGFLKKFCSILWKIEPAKYLGDHIRDVYNAAHIQGGFNPNSCDRLSKLSLSDSDINQKSKTTQLTVTQSCAVCKKLKKDKKQLEKRNNELYEQVLELCKENGQLRDTNIKIEAQLDVLQDQLKQEENDRENLRQAVPKLQEAVTLIERNCRAAETSGAQQTLKRISNQIHEQNKREKNQILFTRQRNYDRESMLSMLSDTSSIAESSIPGEEMTRSSGNSCEITLPHQTNSEKMRVTSDTAQPAGSGRQRYNTIALMTAPRHLKEQDDRADQSPPSWSTAVEGPSLGGNQDSKGEHQGHIRSESSLGSTSVQKIKQRSNSHPRKGRHYSVSESMGLSTKSQGGRSQSLKNSTRSTEQANLHAHLKGELQIVLDERRKKVESQVATSTS